MEEQKYLTNVVIIRPILILFLVFYHAFAPYSGAWKAIDGYPDVPLYWWLDKLSYAFMLETFVFVSGLVFGYQVRRKGILQLETRILFKSKIKRLIIPSILFSLLYIIIFQNNSMSLWNTTYLVVNGVAHMWFLPMLFWCFVGVWGIEKFQIKAQLVIPVLLVSSIISFIPLPIQLGKSMYYMFFFYFGYVLQRNSIQYEYCCTKRICVLLILIFISSFFSLTYLSREFDLILGTNERFVIKAIVLSMKNILKITYSSVGIAMLLCSVGLISRKISSDPSQWIFKTGKLCMGVYLFQQFVLKILYDHTSLPALVGVYWLPWYGFAIGLIISLLLSYSLRLFKIGRFLIG